MTPKEKPSGDSPAQDPPDHPKGKGKKSYLLRVLEERRKAGPGEQYYRAALNHGVPMVFCRYDGRHMAAIIVKDGRITFTLKTNKGRLVVDKTDLQFSYRARSHGEVNQAICIDEQIRSMKNDPIKEIDQRYQIPDEGLQKCLEEGNKLRLKLRGGEVLEGKIEWFGAYDIKLDLATGRSVVVFRHAVYSHEAIAQPGATP